VLCYLQNEKILDILLLLFFNTMANATMLPPTSLNLLEIHLVRCVTFISHRHFAPGRTLVISSPTTYRGVQQEIIAEIHRNPIWPVVVTVDGNISIPDKSDFIDRDGSYIILIPDGNIESFKAQINRLAQQAFRYTRLWNSEARFVVVGAKEFSMSRQMEIFDHFSKFRIYNCIIVSQKHDVIDEENNTPTYDNDEDTGMKLVVYTWFPYQSSGTCTEVNDITLLDSWVISAQGHFTKNTNLFPRKISNNLNGCTLKAVVRNGNWYLTTNYVYYNDLNLNVRKYIEGLEWDLFKVVYEQMNMEFVHVHTPEGFGKKEAWVNELIGDMITKRADIALGSLGTNFLNISYLDSTHTYYTVSYCWYVPCSVKYPRWSSIFRILSVELWLVLIISMVITAISTTLFGRYGCTLEWQCYKTLTSSLTNLWAVILGVSVSTMPRASSLRSLFLAWLCFSLAFSTVFQTFLTTFLIDSGYKTPIQNMDELFDSDIGLAYPPEYSYIVENGDETEVSKIKQNRVNCPSYEICENWARYHKNVSILLVDKVAEEKYATGDYVGENSESLLCRLEDGVVSKTGLTMVMFHGDPLLRRVNEIIDRLVEEGLYNYWISLTMDVLKLKSRKIAIVHPLDGYYSFNLYHMQPAFYLLLMGCCVSALCFMVEVLYNSVLS